MAIVKYNVKNVERGQRKQPKPGIYDVKIVEATHRKDGDKNDIELVVEVLKGDFKGARVWTYVHLGEASEWKLAEFVDALGLPQTGSLNTERLKGKTCKVRMNADTYKDEYRARIGSWLAEDATEEEEDGVEDPTVAGEEIDLSEMDLAELRELAEENELDPDEIIGRAKGARALTKLREALEDHLSGEGEDEPEEAEEGEGDEEPPDYSSMDLKELVALAKEREIATTVKQRKDKDALVELLEEYDESAGDEEPAAEEPEEEGDDYDEWDLDELKAELKERKLRTAGSKTVLIGRLRKHDAESGSGDPF